MTRERSAQGLCSISAGQEIVLSSQTKEKVAKHDDPMDLQLQQE